MGMFDSAERQISGQNSGGSTYNSGGSTSAQQSAASSMSQQRTSGTGMSGGTPSWMNTASMQMQRIPSVGIKQPREETRTMPSTGGTATNPYTDALESFRQQYKQDQYSQPSTDLLQPTGTNPMGINTSVFDSIQDQNIDFLQLAQQQQNSDGSYPTYQDYVDSGGGFNWQQNTGYSGGDFDYSDLELPFDFSNPLNSSNPNYYSAPTYGNWGNAINYMNEYGFNDSFLPYPDDPYQDPPLPPDVTPDPTDGPGGGGGGPPPGQDGYPEDGGYPPGGRAPVDVRRLYPYVPAGQSMDGVQVGQTTVGGAPQVGQTTVAGAPQVGQTTVGNAPQVGQTTVANAPTVGGATVADATGSNVTTGNFGVTEQNTQQANSQVGGIVDQAIGEVASYADPAQVNMTQEQLVDQELARILGQDSPLMATARQEAMRRMNARGLTNASMAVGESQRAMVESAMPMAQQNADQAFQRQMENARFRQESGILTATETSRLRSLEAELGQDLSIFNAEQLNNAEMLSAELRAAIEQGNVEAFNEAARQLADLQRDAEMQRANLEQERLSQQADLDRAAAEQQADIRAREFEQQADLDRSVQEQQADIARAEAEQQADLARSVQEQQADITRSETEQQADIDRSVQEQQADIARDEATQQADLDYARQEAEFLERQAYQEIAMEAVTELNKQYMVGEQQIDLQHVIGQYSQLASVNETAGSIMDGYLKAIGQIYSDPKMSSSQAGEAISNMVKVMSGSLAMIAEMNGMDFEFTYGNNSTLPNWPWG
jgi:hypothetical protein